MLIAQKLYKENIAEYLLYMWQIEDLIRANDFDIDTLYNRVISGYSQSEITKQEIKDWYLSLAKMMEEENVKDKGHLSINNKVIIELQNVHSELLKNSEDNEYKELYYKTLPYIVELRAKSHNKNIPEIETCFSALYGFLLMKLQKKEISGETQAAIAGISNFIRMLSKKYQQRQH